MVENDQEMFEENPELVWLFLPVESKRLSEAFFITQSEPVDEGFLIANSRMEGEQVLAGLEGLRKFNVLLEFPGEPASGFDKYSLKSFYLDYVTFCMEESDNY